MPTMTKDDVPDYVLMTNLFYSEWNDIIDHRKCFDEDVDTSEIVVPVTEGINDAPVNVRVYKPKSCKESKKNGCVVYAHGGGAIAGTLE